MSKKKVMALLLAATMVMGSSITAFALEGEEEGGEETTTEQTTGETVGTGSTEGHVDKEVLNMILPTVPDGSTPFAYIMDPERLIQGTDAGKYAEGTVFPAKDTDTGVYFLVGEKEYANTSTTLQAINKSSCDVVLSVKVKTEQNTAKDITLASSSTVATTGDADLYLGLKVGNETTVVSGTEQEVKKTIAGSPNNFETAVNAAQNGYVYQEKANATTWKAMNISMTGAVSKLDIGSDTTAPGVKVTWSYAKAEEGDAAAATDAVDYSAVPATPAIAISGTYSRANNANKFTLSNIGDKTIKKVVSYLSEGTPTSVQIVDDAWEVNGAKTELTIDGATAPFGAGAVGSKRGIGVVLSDDTELYVEFTVNN